MNAFKNHTTTAAPLGQPPAAQIIACLVSELRAAGEILVALRHFGTQTQLLHARIDLQGRGLIEGHMLRTPEREAVLDMAKQYTQQYQAAISAAPVSAAATRDLLHRLRTVAGQSTIKPPAIDLEAADHIEKLQRYIDEAPSGINFVQVTSNPDVIRPDLGDRRFWPVDLTAQDSAAIPSSAGQELVSILEGALADDLVQYHSQEWLARARTAIAKHRSPAATESQQTPGGAV